MSSFWSLWIIVLTIVTLVGVTWLLFANRKTRLNAENEAKTGHVYDGIEEYDNPLPAWWFNLFVLTLIFTVGYLVFYPGMGNFKGLLKWTSIQQWQEEVDAAEEKFKPLYQSLAAKPIPELAKDKEAMKIGQRLFANSCATCHGSDAGGAIGYPNLRDHDWLYGGEPDNIVTSIKGGRNAVMPAWANTLGGKGLEDMASYVLALSKGEASSEHPAAETFQTMCSVCHGADGSGNIALGAPNLTDDIWLYGGKPEQILQSLAIGRNGKMPAQQDILSPEKIHILSAYVYSLSNE